MTPRVGAVAVAAAIGWLALPAAPVFGWVRGRLLPNPDAAVLLAALALTVAALPPRTTSWRGSWRSGAVALPWTALVAFEVARAVIFETTNDDLPLYDAALLGKHLYILARDLYGGLATAGLVAVALAPLAVAFVGTVLAAGVETALAAAPARARWGLAALAVAGCVALDAGLPRGRWVATRMRANATESWALYQEVHTALTTSGHEALLALPVVRRPDLLFYVVESYGNVAATAPDLAPRWGEAVDAMGTELGAAGWSAVSGLSAAPVHGGRSWIADATTLFGIPLRHQSSYEHAITFVDSLPHLPGFLEKNGYSTLLVKPTDRERPGVKNENPFRYDRTVFFAELGYTGPVVGWGVIPDEYSLGFVHDTVLPELSPPTYAFFHLATSHLPWTEAPPLVGDWRSWQEAEGERQRLYVERSIESEARLRVVRFKRWEGDGPGRKAAPDDQRQRYLDNVVYDLRAITARLASGAARPTLVVVMGDHQPPLLAADEGPEVPVHVLATDPALLAAFRAAGFDDGMRPPPTRTIGHEDLFPLLARTLAAP